MAIFVQVSRPVFFWTATMHLKSREVVILLDTTYWRLVSVLRSGKMPQPQKDVSGDFVWSKRDIANARKALQMDRRKASD